MIIYISIPMSGLDFEKQELIAQKWKNHFENQKHKVVNPFELAKHLEKHHKLHSLVPPLYKEYLNYDLHFLKKCTHIFMCDGWELSNGCKTEMFEAIKLKLGILTEKYYKKYVEEKH